MTVAVARVAEEAALEAVLDRLSACQPAPAERARKALANVLVGVRRSIWPEVAWRASRLTNTGHPVEFSWSSRDPAIRWTAEAAGPETPESARLDVAIACLRGMGAAVNESALRALQVGHDVPRFGAWIGGRHDPRNDRYKLYVETRGEAGARLAARSLRPEIQNALPGRLVWRMTGVEGNAEVVELYGRVRQLESWELARLLTHCGLPPAPLLGLIADLTGRAFDETAFPGASGISLAAHPDGSVVGAAWIAFSGPLLGSDVRVMKRVQSLARARDWDTSLYEAIVGGDVESSAQRRHGLVGIGVAADGEPWLQVGVRP